MAEFNGIRAKLDKECLREFPNARADDIKNMKKYLAPQKHETILEVGAGSGFFTGIIADSVDKLIVSDPSIDQLDEVRKLKRSNIEVVPKGADELNLAKSNINAVWSFGALHHCFNKTKALKNFNKILKKDGRLVIIDVFSGSKLAKHFDIQVAKYCITGHEVAFWTDEFAESVCFLTGFQKPLIKQLNTKWVFNSKKDIGLFIYKIHAMTKTTPAECLRGAEEILGVEKKNGLYYVNWPLKLILTKKHD